jgi:hypothetical protein
LKKTKAGLPAQPKKNMKNIEKLLLVAAASVVLAAQAGAAEPLLSPRAKANQVVTVSGTTEDQLYRGTSHLQRGWFAAPSMIASGGVVDADYVHSTTFVSLSPRALATFPYLATLAVSSGSAKPVQVAPLK